MLIPDVNILLHAYNRQAPAHVPARKWWETALSGTRPIGLAWVTALSFLRLMTGSVIPERPLPVRDAIVTIRSWLTQPNVQILGPGEHHADILFGLLEKLGTGGNLTTDAHLAALAIEYNAELVSTDTDFARFPGLRWFNPLRLR